MAKYNIRVGMFETNSSMTHSNTLSTYEEYKAFQNGEMVIYDNELLTFEEAIRITKESYRDFPELLEKNYPELLEEDYSELLKNKERVKEILNAEEEYRTIEEYNDFVSDYETFYKDYTTRTGEKIVSFGYVGRDG